MTQEDVFGCHLLKEVCTILCFLHKKLVKMIGVEYLSESFPLSYCMRDLAPIGNLGLQARQEFSHWGCSLRGPRTQFVSSSQTMTVSSLWEHCATCLEHRVIWIVPFLLALALRNCCLNSQWKWIYLGSLVVWSTPFTVTITPNLYNWLLHVSYPRWLSSDLDLFSLTIMVSNHFCEVFHWIYLMLSRLF